MRSRMVILGMVVSLAIGACAATNPTPEPPPPPLPGPRSLETEVLVARPPGPVDPKDRSERVVDLVFVGGAECVKVLPDPADIFLAARPPWQVRWQVADWRTDNHYWEIDFDNAGAKAAGDSTVLPDDPQNPDDLPPRMGCSGKRAWVSPKPVATGSWTYKVTVYDCAGGQQGAELCATDPTIIIWP